MGEEKAEGAEALKSQIERSSRTSFTSAEICTDSKHSQPFISRSFPIAKIVSGPGFDLRCLLSLFGKGGFWVLVNEPSKLLTAVDLLAPRSLFGAKPLC